MTPRIIGVDDYTFFGAHPVNIDAVGYDVGWIAFSAHCRDCHDDFRIQLTTPFETAALAGGLSRMAPPAFGLGAYINAADQALADMSRIATELK